MRCVQECMIEQVPVQILTKATWWTRAGNTMEGDYLRQLVAWRDKITMFPSKEYCAHSTINMAMKYGLPTSIAIMMMLPANIILLVDMWVMIMRSFPTRVMKISLVKA